MSYTKEYIFNLALNHLGVSAVIQKSEIISPRTTVLNNQYELAKKVVLKAHDWTFANGFKKLTLSTENSPDPRYLYAYDYPNDCVAVRYVVDENGGEYKKFSVTTNSQGAKLILCNISPAILCYTRNLEVEIPESYFSDEFVMVLSCYLAYLSAEGITGSTDRKQHCYQSYAMELARAKAMDANESSEKDEEKRTYLDSRV